MAADKFSERPAIKVTRTASNYSDEDNGGDEAAGICTGELENLNCASSLPVVDYSYSGDEDPATDNDDIDTFEFREISDRLAHQFTIRKQTSYRKAIKSSQETAGLYPYTSTTSEKRLENLKTRVDWTEFAVVGEHIWADTNVSCDFCYVGEQNCIKTGPKKKCSACKIVVHTACINQLDKMNFKCKTTFRDAGIRNYREQNIIVRHHWVHHRRQEGKCANCSKSFPQNIFTNKDIVSICCSWCKTALHNKVSCFTMRNIEEACSMGPHANIIVPPAWIIRIPKHKIQSSIKGSQRGKKRKPSVKRRASVRNLTVGCAKEDSKHYKPFILKPIPTSHFKPIIVFVNPKSGGNQGAKLFSKFLWELNPRQVFDLSQGGPRDGLEFYRKCPNIRLLVCGGDGTVGWILAEMDNLKMRPNPPVAVLPLGTGNDLARTLGWGSSYADDSINKILNYVEESPVVLLDRWNLHVRPNEEAKEEEQSKEGISKLPLTVFNNYFSLGADAQVTLEFHESREANPDKLNSRFKNLMFYGRVGAADLVKRSWKDIANYITLICDDVDMTLRLKELNISCLLFLNITKYSAGTSPWGHASSSIEQRHDDGFLEVIGFTQTQMATIQVGGHGERIIQCREVELITYKTIPVQVDGEPCRLMPSVINIGLRNQANMVVKSKRRGSMPITSSSKIPQKILKLISSLKLADNTEMLRVQVSRISQYDYERLNYNKDQLKQASVPLGIIVVDTKADLFGVRNHIDRLLEVFILQAANGNGSKLSLGPRWCFLDSTTADRFFRIDKAQENLHFLTDISSDDLYVLDPDLTRPEDNVNMPDLVYQDPLEATVNASLAAVSINSLPPAENTLNLQSQGQRGLTPPIQGSPVASRRELGSPALTKKDIGTPPGISDTAHLDYKEKSNQIKVLIDCSKRGEMNKFKELHKNGANICACDQHGMTALHHASRFGHKEIVQYIIENAPKDILEVVDYEKWQTALHKAAWYQRHTICRMLVAAGASLTKTDYQGNTPRLQALKADDSELAAFLERLLDTSTRTVSIKGNRLGNSCIVHQSSKSDD